MKIRSRLVTWAVGLFTAVLLIAGTTSVLLLQRQLIGDIDRQLGERSDTLALAAEREFDFLRPDGPSAGPAADGSPFRGASDMAIIAVDETGTVLFSVPAGPSEDPAPLPDISQTDLSVTGTIVQIGAEGGDGPDYRAQATSIESHGVTVVLAIPLGGVQSTIASMTLIIVVVGAVAVVLLGTGVWWAIRRGLRPIDDMIGAAGHIGEGDLSHRIPAAEPDTEVGELAVALNKMLGQIEMAVDAKTESEERMRRFLSDASHELRTPLTSIRGYAELYHRGATSPGDIDRAFTRIEHEAIRMSDLVDDLLLLARLDQRRPIAAESVDLTRVVSEAIDAARTVDPQRPIDLSPGGSNVFVVGDGARLRQVMDNLLANVRQHTPTGTSVVVAVDADDRHVTVRVADNGPGLNEDQANRICDRFYQAHPERANGGSGLGLSIVDAIIEAHQGSMRIATAPGHGLAVSIELPRQVATPTPSEATST